MNTYRTKKFKKQRIISKNLKYKCKIIKNTVKVVNFINNLWEVQKFVKIKINKIAIINNYIDNIIGKYFLVILWAEIYNTV